MKATDWMESLVTADYIEEMKALYGKGSCYVLRIRPVGGFASAVC